MNTESLFGSLGTELLWQVILSGFGVIAVVAAGVPLIQRRPVHPVLLLAGVLLASLAPFLLGRACLWDLGGRGLEILQLQVTTFAAVHLLAPLTAGPAVSFAALFFAVGGAQGTPRAWVRALPPAILVVVAALLVAGTGWAGGNGLYATVRGGAYVVVGLLASVGTLGSGAREEGALDAGAAAGALLPLVVGLGEASERGLVWLIASQAAHKVPAGKWEEGMALMLAHVRTEWWASHAAVLVACVAAVPSARRAGSRGWVALGASGAVALVLLLGSDLGGRGSALAAFAP